MIEELPDDIENDVLDDIEPVGDESQLYEHFRVVVDKGAGDGACGQVSVRPPDQCLAQPYTESCRCRICDGERQTGEEQLQGEASGCDNGDDGPSRYENEVIPEDIPPDIVYEDKYLMVVNKPAGLVVHPDTGTTAARLSMPLPGT